MSDHPVCPVCGTRHVPVGPGYGEAPAFACPGPRRKGIDLAEVRERDGNRCARCGNAQDLHVHHRVLRSRGGPDSFSNCVTLCQACHEWAHLHVSSATRQGWIVASGTDPATVSVPHHMWPAGRVKLLDNTTFDITEWVNEDGFNVSALWPDEG